MANITLMCVVSTRRTFLQGFKIREEVGFDSHPWARLWLSSSMSAIIDFISFLPLVHENWFFFHGTFLDMMKIFSWSQTQTFFFGQQKKGELFPRISGHHETFLSSVICTLFQVSNKSYILFQIGRNANLPSIKATA